MATKTSCRKPALRGGLAAVPLRGKVVNDKKRRIMGGRSRIVKVRMTAEEFGQVRERAAPFGTVSGYVREALRAFPDVDAKRRLAMIEDFNSFSRKFRDELAWMGGNLNQASKRANELAAAGLLRHDYLQETFLPVVAGTKESVDRLRSELEAAIRGAAGK